MLGLTFPSILHWGSCIISIAKTASNKIGALIGFMKFLSPEVALYFYKSTKKDLQNFELYLSFAHFSFYIYWLCFNFCFYSFTWYSYKN